MKYLITAILLSTSIFLSAKSEKNPALTLYQMVSISADKVLETIKANQEKEEPDIATLADSLLVLLDPIVDFKSISKSVMGKYYKKTTAELHKEFENNFKITMSQLYAKALIKFKIDTLTVNKPDLKSPDKGKITIIVKTSSGSEYQIVYSMRRDKEGTWKIRNVILDGINLGLTYRNQFYSAADRHQGDAGKVISAWATEME